MSKLSDYSKFDHIDTDSDDSQHEKEITKKSFKRSEGGAGIEGSMSPVQVDPDIQNMLTQSTQHSITKQGSEIDRYVYEYEGRKIYEWDQNLEGEKRTSRSFNMNSSFTPQKKSMFELLPS